MEEKRKRKKERETEGRLVQEKRILWESNFQPVTPRGELKKELQRKVDERDIEQKIEEKTGYTLKRVLQTKKHQ